MDAPRALRVIRIVAGVTSGNKPQTSPVRNAMEIQSLSHNQGKCGPTSKQALHLGCPLSSENNHVAFALQALRCIRVAGQKTGSRLPKAVNVLVVLVTLSTCPLSAEGKSYTFLREAIREYHDNPTLETKAQLEKAQTKAAIYDGLTYSIPVAVILVALALYVRGVQPKHNGCRRGDG